MKKKILATLVILCLMLSSMTCLSWAADSGAVSYKTAMSKTESYMIGKLQNPGYNDEWYIIGLARGGAAVSDSAYNTYYNNLVKEVKNAKGVLDKRKYTEYSRVILALTAIGKDPKNVGGYNLLEKLADFENVKWQGINGPIWALIALDSKMYEIPTVRDVEVQTTRDLLIKEILSQEIEGGGFSLDGKTPDSDITGMAIQALSGYMNRTDVKAAVERALAVLSDMQKADGGFASFGTKNAESNCQVIVALTTLGIDPTKDDRFIRNGKSVLDALLTYYVSETGGFRHVNTSTAGYKPVVNSMSTEQGYYTLVAYDRLLNGKSSLYDMTDGKTLSKPGKVTISSLKSTKTKTMTVKWKKLSSVAGVQIRYAANSKFTGSKTVTASKSATAATIKGLKKGKTYYVKARAYKSDVKGNKIYGSYSTVKKVKVK